MKKKILFVSISAICFSFTNAKIIDTVAGDGYIARSGNGGYAGDGSSAILAELGNPTEIVMDKAGNIYLADEGNNLTQKITESSAGIEQLGNVSNINVSQNPSNGEFTIQLLVSSSQSSVEVYNVLGERVYSNQLLITNYSLSINLSNQRNDVYLYRVLAEDDSLIGEGKLMIRK